MNPRIKELAEQSFDITKDNRDRVEYSADSYGIEKFAELIIKECANIALREDHDPSDCILNHFGVKR